MRDDKQTTSEDRATQLLICEPLSLANILNVHWPTWGGVRGSSPLPLLLPGTFGAWRTISPLLDILGHITASFRKDGIKEWGVLLVVDHDYELYEERFCNDI